LDSVWTPEKIENYKRASEYSSFHRKLSILAEPYLDERWSLADIGCGPGLIDFWIAPMVSKIDAIDNNPAAIDDLTSRLEDVFATNRAIADKITPRLAALEELSAEKWDAVLMSFFGIDEKIIESLLSLAEHRAFIYMHGRDDQKGPLAVLNDGKKFSAEEMEAYLAANRYKYKKSVMEMQFGQPFKTIGDIHTFLSGFGDGSEDSERYIAGAEERIIKTNRFDFPYYLPKSISVVLFIILVGRSA